MYLHPHVHSRRHTDCQVPALVLVDGEWEMAEWESGSLYVLEVSCDVDQSNQWELVSCSQVLTCNGKAGHVELHVRHVHAYMVSRCICIHATPTGPSAHVHSCHTSTQVCSCLMSHWMGANTGFLNSWRTLSRGQNPLPPLSCSLSLCFPYLTFSSLCYDCVSCVCVCVLPQLFFQITVIGPKDFCSVLFDYRFIDSRYLLH